MESLRDLFIRLGLSVDAASFAEGLAWEHALEKGAELVKEAFLEVPEFLKESIEKTAEFGEEMEVLAQKTGFGVDAIQKLSYAAQLSHSSAEDLRIGIGHLAREIEKAKDGGDSAQKAFTKIGISMTDLRTKSPEEIFMLLSDRMVATKDASKRMASAMDLLGKGGANLLPTLLRGSDGLHEMGVEADAFGAIMSEDAVHAAAEFKESLEKAEQVIIGLEHELAGPLIEALAPVLHAVLDWVKANRALIGQRVKQFAELVIGAVKLLGSTIMGVVKTIGWMVDHVKLLAVVLGSVLVAAILASNISLGQLLVNFVLNSAAALAYAAISTWAAISSAAAWLAAAAPIVLIAAGLVLAALAAEDFYTFIKGGDSLLGHLLNTYGERFTKWMESLTQPHSGDPWQTRWLRSILAVLIDMGPWIDKISAGFEYLFGGRKRRLDSGTAGAWESYSASEMAESAAEQAQRIKTTQAIYGGGGSPGASAAAAQAGANFVHAPSFNASVQIVQGPGQSAGGVADQVTSQMDEWWDTKMRQAAPLAPTSAQ